MDLLQQSLSFASTWAFEDIGVQELEIELRLHLPEVSLHCEYSPGDEVLVFKGRLDNHHALIAKLVSTFIEKQKRKDLLDTPRIRPLALPIAVRESATNTGCSQTDSTDSLLALVDSNEIIPHHRTLVTKFWLSSTGGVGCFAASNHLKTLQDIAKATGTEISVPQGTKAIQVSGGNASDVDDALVKLTEIERPLSFICSPNISNIDVHPGEENARYKIQPAEESSSACVRRILIDPADALSGANVQLGQMFVTVFYSFDEETRKSTAAKSLLQPPTYSSELITPRPWSDFTFQELGDNDEYDPLDLALDNNVESRLVASVISDEHPFLSPEKAKEVGQWVVNDADLDAPDVAHEAKPEALDAHRPCPRSPRESPGSLEGAKRPGIKVRRPVQPVQATTAQDIKVHAPQAQPSAPEVISDRVTSTPRKKWKMTYEPTSDDPPRAQNSRAPSNFDDNTLGSLSQPAEEFTRSYLRQPGGKSPSPPFDAGNYGLRKKSTQLLKSVKNLQQAGKTSRDTPPLVRSNRTLEKNVLVDVALDDVVSLDSQLWQVGVSANAPALIPTVAEHSNAFGNLGSGSSMHSFSLQSRSHITDLLGSDLHEEASQDLKRSKAEGKSRIFEQDYSYYNVSYEFHCITRTGGLLIVALGEDGKYTIRNPSSVLGAVNLHFPKQIWDARAVVDSTAQYHPEINPEFDEAVKFLVDHVSIPATKTIRISTSLPNENKPTIKKVFMKRWTRHRFIRPGELSRDLDKGSDHGSQVGSIERTDTQDIFLQVTEVQDLLIHVDNKEDPRCVRAECKATVEMTRDGRLWYEVSLVSPALEAILKANMSLEVGERTKDWRAADLLGEHAALCGEDSSDSVAANPVAMAIGAGGVANLVELAKTLVPKIDGVGFSNAERTATGGNTEVSNGKSFKELDSVKEVESVAARIDQSGHVSQFAKREKFERDYW
ncbi:hypothetical protein BJX64DRAFT_285536 [Aspergillus heterothallicus]